MKKIKIVVATHKQFQMPADKIYLPVHVGATGKKSIGYQRDDIGDNISKKNPYYCELTGLYWAIHNLDEDYIGLTHYRRHFRTKHHSKTKNNLFENISTGNEIDKLLDRADIILPKKRKYYIENLYDHYKHTLHIEPLDITGEIIKERYPNYYPEFLRLHKRTSMHAFNMIIAKKEILRDYCDWLFDILSELEKRVDNGKYSDFHKRFYGRISERLLDVYIYTNNLKYIEVPVIHLQKINWIKKGTSFLMAKLGGRKYEKSF